jgi:MFS family permease
VGSGALACAAETPSVRAPVARQLVSSLGDWLNLLALLSLLLYEWNLGAPAWAAVLTAMSLPAAMLGPVAGVWADRWSRRTTMIACDLLRGVVVLGLVWAPNAYLGSGLRTGGGASDGSGYGWGRRRTETPEHCSADLKRFSTRSRLRTGVVERAPEPSFWTFSSSPAPALQPSTHASAAAIGGSAHRTRCHRDRP